MTLSLTQAGQLAVQIAGLFAPAHPAVSSLLSSLGTLLAQGRDATPEEHVAITSGIASAHDAAQDALQAAQATASAIAAVKTVVEGVATP